MGTNVSDGSETVSANGDADSEGLVTVGQFADPVEAQMARGMLQSAGVECVLLGKNVNDLLVGLYGTRTVLRVRAEDEAAALELIAQAAFQALGEDPSAAEGRADAGGRVKSKEEGGA